MKRFIISLLTLSLFSACSNKTEEPATPVVESAPSIPQLDYSVVHSYPHDITLFTEGFVFHNGQLFESTGSPEDLPQTKSMIGISDLNTGKFTKKIEIDKNTYFGEGIAFLNDKLYQLTYKNQLGFIYDAKTFKKTGQFTYNNAEGWGMTTDGSYLIMSDGTHNLTYFDPVTLAPIKTLTVTESGAPQNHLNELEFIKGFIYANIWMENNIVKIDPANGQIVGKIDLTLLASEAILKNPRMDVLNGIAYDAATDKIYVTGKLWANIYEISFTH